MCVASAGTGARGLMFLGACVSHSTLNLWFCVRGYFLSGREGVWRQYVYPPGSLATRTFPNQQGRQPVEPRGAIYSGTFCLSVGGGDELISLICYYQGHAE